ncbi:MAG TPA: ribosome maturation factor RimM [Afifellaceae bacterium]|nr:ribosome maturation factor RimM [Afifellaceae bacterium]
MDPDDLILVARIGAPHGVNGAVRVKAFTEEAVAVGDYGPLVSKDGRIFEITDMRPDKTVVIIGFAGVDDRDAAQALNGTELYVARSALPASDDADEFYHADLIGLAAVTSDGETLGTVVAVQDFGAGDILEIEKTTNGQTLLLPFTRAVVPEVDLAGGRIVVVPPAEVEARGETETPQGDET